MSQNDDIALNRGGKIRITPQQAWFLWKTMLNQPPLREFVNLLANREPMSGHLEENISSDFLNEWARAFAEDDD